jgi:hypothetical protein
VGADFVGDPAVAGQLEATWWEPTLSAIPRQRARLRQAPIADEVGSHQALPRRRGRRLPDRRLVFLRPMPYGPGRLSATDWLRRNIHRRTCATSARSGMACRNQGGSHGRHEWTAIVPVERDREGGGAVGRTSQCDHPGGCDGWDGHPIHGIHRYELDSHPVDSGNPCTGAAAPSAPAAPASHFRTDAASRTVAYASAAGVLGVLHHVR